MDKRVRDVVDRYLSVLIVSDLNDDAGWRAEHLMGRMIDFEGDLPPHMGGGDSNANMIYQVRFMFEHIDNPRTKQACKIMEVLKKRDEKACQALLAQAYLKRRPDSKTGKSYHTQARMAEEVKMSRSAFLNRLAAGESFVRDMVEIACIIY